MADRVQLMVEVTGKNLSPRVVIDEVEMALEEINTGLVLNDLDRWRFSTWEVAGESSRS